MYLIEKFCILIQIKFVPKGPIANNTALAGRLKNFFGFSAKFEAQNVFVMHSFI